MADINTGVFRPSPTRLLDASYNGVVPDKTSKIPSVKKLDKLLTQMEEEEEDTVGRVPFMNFCIVSCVILLCQHL